MAEGNPFDKLGTVGSQADSQQIFFGGDDGMGKKSEGEPSAFSLFETPKENNDNDDGKKKATRETGTDQMPFTDPINWNFGSDENKHKGKDDEKTGKEEIEFGIRTSNTKDRGNSKDAATSCEGFPEFDKLSISNGEKETRDVAQKSKNEGKTEGPESEEWRSNVEVSDMIDVRYETMFMSCW